MVEGLFQGSLFFVSGLVVIIAVVGIVYAISWFFDRVSGSADSLLTPEELEQRRLATGLVRHAGLAGMLPAEQNRVMRHFFEKSSYPYVKDPVDDDDIEAHKNRKEDEPPKEKESNRIEDIATTAEVNSDDGTASTDEKGHVPEKVDEKDLEADLENQTDETIEEGEATDMEADAKKEAECIKNRGIAHTEEAANNDETVQDEDMNAHLEADTVEDDVKETLEDKTDEENQDSNSQHDDSECEKESHVEDVEDEEGVCPICLSEYDDGERIVIGSSCGHMYHFECFMQWMEKKPNECPFCRSDMMTSDEFLAAAYDVLGEARVNKLKNINEEAARRLAAWYAKHPRQEELETSPNVQASQQPAAGNATASTDSSS